MRPMKVAVPVASATGRNVRALSSGIISSIANITPPIGVLKVARDAGSGAGGNQRDALPRRHADHLPERRAERGADLDDRSFASDRRAGADRQRRGERFDQRHDWSDDAVLVVDCVHNLGHAMAARFRCEIRDQKSDEHAADDGHQDDERAPWNSAE